MKTRLLTLLCSFAAAGVFAANTWYADANAEDDSGDGTSPETARKHIQSLIDDSAVKAGDTIILKPGMYNDGNATDNSGYKARVYVNKKLTIKGMEGKRDETFVTGKPADTATGVGSGAVRAFSVDADTVIIEGITICGGYGPATSGNSSHGGGVCFKNNTSNWIIDCVVSNCAAYRGGAISSGIAIRCLFTENTCLDSGSYGVVSSTSTKMLNSLVVRNSGSSCYLFNGPSTVVNCTIAGNMASRYGYTGSTPPMQIYNSIVTENSFTLFANPSHTAVLSNCLITAGMSNYSQAESAKTSNTNAPAYGFCAPALGDWRPTAVSGAVGRGDASLLSKIAVPSGREELRYTDYAGNPISQMGSICAGAIQETAGVAAAFETSAKWECEGSDWTRWHTGTYGKYAHATNWPVMLKIRRKTLDAKGMVWFEDASGFVYVPYTNGWVGVVLPPTEGSVFSLTTRANDATLWVDGENGDNSYAGDDIGSEDHPYETIQAAVNAAPSGTSSSKLKYTMIRVKRGTYKAASGIVVSVPSDTGWYKRIRICSEDGPEHTVIDGQDTCRCVSFLNPAAIQGFTVTRGHTTATDGSQGAAFHAGANSLNYYMVDCIISNHVGCAAVQRGCTTVRCRFLKNSGTQVVNGRAIGCIIKAAGSAFEGTAGKAYFCTVETSTTKTTDSGFGYYGCLFKGMGSLSSTGPAVGCFGHNTTIGGAGASGCSTGKAKFIDGDGDYRFYASSGAVGAVGFDSLDGFWKYAMLDLDGNPIYKTNDGITAGARQWPSIWQDPGFVFYIW